MARGVSSIDGAWRLIDRIVYEYDIEGHVIKETDFAGRVTTTVWGGSCCGKTSMTLPNGVRYTYAYDAEGRLVAETKLDPLPCTAHTEYDALGRVVKTWRDGLNPETTTYDLFGQIASRTDVRGGVTTYAYSADGRTVTTTLPNGGTQVNVTDVFGRLVSVSGTAAIPQTIAYGPLRTRVSSGARWQKEERNLLGQVVRETRPGANGSTLETLTTYDAYGRPAQIISTGAPAQTFVYAPTGARTALTQTVGNETRRLCTKSRYFVEEGKVWHERAFRDETSAATVPPQTWGWRWQCTGLTQTNAFTIVAQDSRGNAFRYHGNDAEARLRLPWCSNERIWRFAGGALVEAVDSACVTNRVTRDALGRVVAHTDGRGNTTRFVYSAGNLLEKQCDAMGVETGYGYDVMGNLTAITNGLGYVTVFEYDVRGNRTYEGGATYPVRYVYDEHGAIVAMTTYRDEASGQGDTTRWEYDAATGSLLKEIAPDGATIQYAYMDTGATKTRIDARGITTHYAYDGWGNLLSKTYSDGTPSVVYTRDARGRPLTIQDARGLSRWNWTDKYERDDRSTDYVVSAAVPYYPYSLVYYMKLDAYGRRLNHSMTLGRGNTNCHDPATGRVIAVGDVSASRHDIAYLPNTHQQASRAVGDGNDRLTTIWTYEAKRDLPVAIQNAGFSDYAYRYDALGRCVERTITRHPLPDRNEVATAQTTVERFRYNWRDELIAENDITYTYDDCGNRKAAGGRTYQTNARNQYTAITNPADTTTPTFTPTYDADGNQTRVLTQTGIWEVAYDAENRPTRFTQGAKTISFLYDYLGRCVARAASLNGTTNWNAYVYCGRYCITHHDSRKINGNAYDRHIQWDYSEDCRSARPLGAWDITNGRDLHYFYDGQGNLSDIALGTIGPPPVLRYTYSAFGEWTSTFHNRDAIEIREGEHERALRTCPFGFSGEMRDDDLGLVRYLRRWYNPRDARWITPDPAPESRYRPNRYLFVRNNPLNLRDAFGEKPYKPFTFPNDVNIVQRGGLPGQDTLALAVISYFYLNDGIPVSPLSFNSEDILSLDSAVKQDCCEGSLRGVNYTIKPFAAHVTIAISPNVWDKRDLPPSQTGLTRVHTIVEHEQIHITNAKTEFDQATKLLQNALGDCEPEACDASRRAYVELGLKELRLNRQLQDFQLHFEDYLEENAPPQSQKEDLETELNEIRTQKEKVHMEHGTCILNQPK